MKNPGEAANPFAESETTAEENTIEIDPCSSPPCKRLKQAVLPFKFMSSSQATTSVSLEAVQPLTYSTCTNINQCEVSVTKEESCRNTSLVTGAPSPDVELSSEQQQISRSSDLEGEAKRLAFRSNTSSPPPPSLQMNSPTLETDVMAVDLSPPNVLQNQEADCAPHVTSAEKPKKSKEEREKEKLERQKLREVKLREKQEIKAAREKERLEAKRKREEERQEKLAERERKEKEKLEKREKEEKERLEKKEKRDEERKKREEERSAKTEEKRKRDEEKRSLEEEQARKRQKVQESFANYFTKTTNSTPKTLPKTCSRFRPFEIKPGMSLAPVTRKQSSSENKNLLDQELFRQECGSLYLKELAERKPIPKYTKQKLPSIAEDEVEQDLESEPKKNEGVVVIDENSSSSIEILENKATTPTVGLKRKLLQFHTNHRPAYFGTWRKKSQHISPKNPFKKDTDLLDYDVDSDDEWEEEEPGESLSNSEGEDEDGEEDGDEDDDGFFVPHGYLSDDEGVEDEDGENGDKGNETNSKQAQQLAKAKAWEAEMKKKCKPQKPVIVGCLWHEDATLNTTLKQFAAVLLVDEPIEMSNVNKGSEAPGSELFNAANGGLYVPNEAMPDLIKLVHGNTAGLNKLVLHFRKQWMTKCLGRKVTDEEVDEKSPISKRQLEKRIQLIATKERRTDRLRWYVHNNILEKFSLENLQLADTCNTFDASTECSKIPGLVTPSNTPSIMQFAKTVSPLNRGSSHELKSITSAIKLGHTENQLSSWSPMEVDIISAPFHNGQKTMQSETPVTSNVAFNSLLKRNNVVAPICKKLDLTTAVDGKTGSNAGQAMSLPNGVETICVD